MEAQLWLGLDIPLDANANTPATRLHDQRIFDTTRLRLVKLYRPSQAGQPAGEFSGFLYSPSAPVIVTAGHIAIDSTDHPPGTEPPSMKFRARYGKGIVSRAGMGCLTVTAPADRGYVGGPVVNKYGHLLGIIAEGVDAAMSAPGLNITGSAAPPSQPPLILSHGLQGSIFFQGREGPSVPTAPQVRVANSTDLHTFLLQSGQPGLAT
ncbi:hypothetical protein HYH03_009513 [Edaphochlamys debaryana]|uniref:Serine protease n=1 Tax=Edaphochlamys debaryana TaxID=47281 RepID=A0A835XXZ3_9CHLO|nr:hypothetical protein HYH03_009513 [Edaphochlamys debaryana]|eukprot:KAG2492273.1 hypothetical protein HYH03_009513 [Edaphochlamys debaryana]